MKFSWLNLLGGAVVLAAVTGTSTSARADEVEWFNGFEGASYQNQWFTSNNAGFDVDKGWAYAGLDNGWVYAAASSTSVWNSINAPSIPTNGYTDCYIQAYVAASSTVESGEAKINVWNNDCVGGSCSPIVNLPVSAGNNGGWVLVDTYFTGPSGSDSAIFVDLGVFNITTNDQWVRLDNVTVSCDND